MLRMPPDPHAATASEDYLRIARAIDYLRLHAASRPSLEEVAGAVDLSPFHLQRVFSRWAGISPKRFLQLLTLASAKRTLRSDTDLLGASLDLGLSGSGRLHDLFVTLEAVTPGDYKSRGRGRELRFGTGESPFGRAFVGFTGRGVCALEFFDSEEDLARIKERFHADWRNASIVPDQQGAAATLGRIFPARARRDVPVSLFVQGTNFQVQVWRALLAIPRGQVTTYGALAGKIGRPRSYRAVANALGSNRIALLIPCHRVLREGGGLGGYRWGETRKVAALAREEALLT